MTVLCSPLHSIAVYRSQPPYIAVLSSCPKELQPRQIRSPEMAWQLLLCSQHSDGHRLGKGQGDKVPTVRPGRGAPSIKTLCSSWPPADRECGPRRRRRCRRRGSLALGLLAAAAARLGRPSGLLQATRWPRHPTVTVRSASEAPPTRLRGASYTSAKPDEASSTAAHGSSGSLKRRPF